MCGAGITTYGSGGAGGKGREIELPGIKDETLIH
jgi:hypothetical protein